MRKRREKEVIVDLTWFYIHIYIVDVRKVLKSLVTFLVPQVQEARNKRKKVVKLLNSFWMMLKVSPWIILNERDKISN